MLWIEENQIMMSSWTAGFYRGLNSSTYLVASNRDLTQGWSLAVSKLPLRVVTIVLSHNHHRRKMLLRQLNYEVQRRNVI